MHFPWDDDDPNVRARIQANLAGLLPDILASGRRRDPFSLDLAQDWHRRMLEDVQVAQPEVAGGFRGSGPPKSKLQTYRVTVDRVLEAVRPGQVRIQMRLFEHRLAGHVAALDPLIAPKALPAGREGQVLELCAWAHGDFIRVHPFADGNGRIARAWVLWLSGRYGLPAFLDLRPRPGGSPYEVAAKASMTGRHQLTEIVFTNMLADYRQRQAN